MCNSSDFSDKRFFSPFFLSILVHAINHFITLSFISDIFITSITFFLSLSLSLLLLFIG